MPPCCTLQHLNLKHVPNQPCGGAVQDQTQAHAHGTATGVINTRAFTRRLIECTTKGTNNLILVRNSFFLVTSIVAYVDSSLLGSVFAEPCNDNGQFYY